jgi:hypothetical protein
VLRDGAGRVLRREAEFLSGRIGIDATLLLFTAVQQSAASQSRLLVRDEPGHVIGGARRCRNAKRGATVAPRAE